uniref:Butyrophilin subfamily 3 member A2-like n=1 Tax=Seriola dumerili TaxID=41447 RepID=A0A3B4UN11_SERDU
MFCFNNRHVCLHLITLQVNILINTCFYLPGPEIIKVTEGSDVTLPCSITGDIESRRFDWKKDGQKEVYVYDSGLDYSQGLSGQHEQFKGRVSHFPGELKNGNASITIRNTTVADSGNYTCEFKHLSNQKFLMKLLVGECFHHTADYLQMRLLVVREYFNKKVHKCLKCEVQGAFPQPTLQWQDSDGKVLPAEEPRVSERGGRYSITLQTTVTSITTNRFHCVAKQENIGHVVNAEIIVPSKISLSGFTLHVVSFYFSWSRDPSCFIVGYNQYTRTERSTLEIKKKRTEKKYMLRRKYSRDKLTEKKYTQDKRAEKKVHSR